MKRNQTCLRGLALLLAVLLTTACSSAARTGQQRAGSGDSAAGQQQQAEAGAAGAAGTAGAASLTLNFSSPFPASDYRTRAYQWFADEVGTRTSGAVKIQVHPGGALTPVNQAFQALASGTVDIATLPSSYVSTQVKEMAVFDLSGAYPSERWLEVEEEVRDVLDAVLSRYNVKYLFADYESGTVVTLRPGAQPIHRPGDWQPYKIRDYGTWIGRQLRIWGGTPVNIPLQDLTSAVQNRTVDGVYIGWPNVLSFKLYETTPVISYVGLSVLWHPAAMSAVAWNKLTPEQQEIFRQVGAEAAQKSEEFGKAYYKEFEAAVQQSGATLYVLTPEEQQAHLDVLKPLFDEIAAQQETPEGRQLVEILERFRQ